MKILTVFGTRPEAIKMAPVIKALKNSFGDQVKVCVTAQHRMMLDQVLTLFQLKPDYDLNLMQANQALAGLTAAVLTQIEQVLVAERPDRVLVQGDTTTAFAAALAAFYQKIPVGHVEAGLRSHNFFAPWPEELNRKLIASLADLHFAPTEIAANNLLQENIAKEQIFITGNTVIDALLEVKSLLEHKHALSNQLDKQFAYLDRKKKLILVTGHRRENFGEGMQQICMALAQLAAHPEVEIIYPVHLNPNVQEPVKAHLSIFQNIFLIAPQDYLTFVYLLQRSYLILTDSGGIQEEAPAFGKPVLIMRETTERQEAILAGTAKLVGTRAETIVAATLALLTDEAVYHQASRAHNPFGDGKAAERIVALITSLKKS